MTKSELKPDIAAALLSTEYDYAVCYLAVGRLPDFSDRPNPSYAGWFAGVMKGQMLDPEFVSRLCRDVEVSSAGLVTLRHMFPAHDYFDSRRPGSYFIMEVAGANKLKFGLGPYLQPFWEDTTPWRTEDEVRQNRPAPNRTIT